MVVDCDSIPNHWSSSCLLQILWFFFARKLYSMRVCHYFCLFRTNNASNNHLLWHELLEKLSQLQSTILWATEFQWLSHLHLGWCYHSCALQLCGHGLARLLLQLFFLIWWGWLSNWDLREQFAPRSLLCGPLFLSHSRYNSYAAVFASVSQRVVLTQALMWIPWELWG